MDPMTPDALSAHTTAAGTTITARRVAQGDYRVCFPHGGTLPLVGDASFNDFVSVDLAIHEITCDGQEFKVTTRNTSVTGTLAPSVAVTIVSADVPATPTNLVATDVSDTEIDLSFQEASTTQIGFTLQRGRL